jgi:CHAT domain-containing protein/Tfp pilus assembly protein PilF
LENYQQALAIHQQIDSKAGEGATLNGIGEVYRNLGQYPQALEYYQQALSIAQEIGNKATKGTTLNNIGLVHRNLGQYPQALENYQQALSIAQEIGDKAGEGRTLNNIGAVYNSLGQYPQALENYQQALAMTKEIGDKAGEGTTLNNIGAVYRNLGQYPQTLENYQQALTIRQEIGDKAGEGATLNNIGAVYNTQGQYSHAQTTLFAAIDIWESLRARELKDDQKISIFEQQAHSYRFLQQALVAQNKFDKALEIAERSRGRALVDLLDSKLSQNPSNQPNIKPPNLQEIQQIASQQNATLVQYSIIDEPFQVEGKQEGQQKLYIWVIKPTGEIAFKQVDLKSLNTSLADLVTNGRDDIGVRSRSIFEVTPTDSQPQNQTKKLEQLHKLLIAPIADLLPKDPNERVIFIPQESLFLVPFGALQDEQGKYLIEKHTILTAPAIQVLDLTRKQKQNGQRSAGGVLIVGNPTMPKIRFGELVANLDPLPGSEREANQIAKFFNTEALTGSKATKAAVMQKMQQARIIHLATHGLLHDFKGFGVPGAIALAPNPPLSPLSKGGNDGIDSLLTAGEIFDMKLSADLVVLSACDTGRGDIKGDGVIGLSRSLISAGVPSVLVSLWAVSDSSTAFLMTEFYRNLQQNPDKAVALRQAMLTTMKQYPNPLQWAAFTLIGEAD